MDQTKHFLKLYLLVQSTVQHRLVIMFVITMELLQIPLLVLLSWLALLAHVFIHQELHCLQPLEERQVLIPGLHLSQHHQALREHVT